MQKNEHQNTSMQNAAMRIFQQMPQSRRPSMNEIIDKELEAEFKKYNVTNEDDLQTAIHRENIRKYQALNIKPHTEARLKRAYQQYYEKRTTQQLDRGHYFDWMLKESRITKQMIARAVFLTSLECPNYSITEICRQSGLSQGYYRELRAIHKKEWMEEHLSFEEDAFIVDVVYANDKDINDNEYNRIFGKDFPRSLLKV